MSNLTNGASKEQMIELLNSIKLPVLGVGGGFAPIGTENYFEGTTAPVGWVICDGSVLNIADYPELATYYASHYGASNHFGGDGITTFAVPTRSGMSYSNEGYSTSEKIIGVDNNRKPIYRKHITGLSVSLTSADSWQNLTAISGADSLIDLKMYYYDSETGFLQVYTRESELYDTIDCMIIVKGLIGVNRIVTDVIAEYTKGADSAVSLGHSSDGNGVFCVKATVAGDSNAHQYSTEEQIVGTWIDGSPEYELTYHFNSNVQVPSQTWTSITGTDATNIKMLTKVTIIREDAKFVADMMADVDNGKIELMNTRSQSIEFNVLIARYTKTS